MALSRDKFGKPTGAVIITEAQQKARDAYQARKAAQSQARAERKARYEAMTITEKRDHHRRQNQRYAQTGKPHEGRRQWNRLGMKLA
jgi:hypothetical protein